MVKYYYKHRSLLIRLQERMATLEGNIASETADLEQLKFVLNIIAEIQKMTQDIEFEMLDITERYCTLARYKIDVPQQEMHDGEN